MGDAQWADVLFLLTVPAAGLLIWSLARTRGTSLGGRQEARGYPLPGPDAVAAGVTTPDLLAVVSELLEAEHARLREPFASRAFVVIDGGADPLARDGRITTQAAGLAG